MSIIRYLVKRTAITIFLIFLIASALFVFFRQMPGTFADILIAEGLSLERAEALERKWGLNESIYVQYYKYLVNLLTLEAGTSFQYRQDVWTVVSPRLVNTIVLVLPAVMAAYIWAALFGFLMGLKRGSLFEKFGVGISTAFRSVPEFYLAIILVIIFSTQLGIFPTSEMLPIGLQQEMAGESIFTKMGTVAFWMHYTLPFMTVFLYFQTVPALTMRTSVIDVLGQDFLYYHRIKGIPRRKKVQRMIKHSSLPLITLLPLSMTAMISGVVLIEVVFNWPGIGRLLVDSIVGRDYPVVQFVFLLAAILVIIGNYIVDILYSVLDPRIAIE